MNAIRDVKSFEQEYSALKAPGVGLPGASGDGDLFGQFGNMLQGLASGGDASTLKASKETSAVKYVPDAYLRPQPFDRLLGESLARAHV